MCTYCNFINTIFTVDNFWSIAQTVLGGVGIYIAWLIYQRQEYNSNKDAELNRALSVLVALNVDINTAMNIHRNLSQVLHELHKEKNKLENTTLDIDEVNSLIKEIEEGISNHQKSIDDYYDRRNAIIDEYHLKLSKTNLPTKKNS